MPVFVSQPILIGNAKTGYVFISVPDPNLLITDPEPDPPTENHEFRNLLSTRDREKKLYILVKMKEQTG